MSSHKTENGKPNSNGQNLHRKLQHHKSVEENSQCRHYWKSSNRQRHLKRPCYLRLVVSSLTEISFFKSEISLFMAEAVFMKAIKIQAAMITSRYFVFPLIEYNILFEDHIDDYV